MKHAHGLALLVLLGGLAELRGQFPVGPRFPAGGVGFTYQRRHLSVSGFWGNPWLGLGYPVAPLAYPVPVPSVALFYQPPPVIYSPPIVINQPVVVLPERLAGLPDDDQFLRFVPRQREPNADKLRPAPARPPEAVPVPRERKPAAPLPPSRSDRLLSLGKRAFAEQLYGRAERFFGKAAEVPPVDPLALFYRGQAQFARGEYQEAVASLQSGLRLAPEWVRSSYRATELYAGNVNDFQEHVQRLEETLSRHPNDPALLFLYGYELWFSGRQDEARAQLQRAVRAGADAGLVQLFLNVPVGGTVARATSR